MENYRALGEITIIIKARYSLFYCCFVKFYLFVRMRAFSKKLFLLSILNFIQLIKPWCRNSKIKL